MKTRCRPGAATASATVASYEESEIIFGCGLNGRDDRVERGHGFVDTAFGDERVGAGVLDERDGARSMLGTRAACEHLRADRGGEALREGFGGELGPRYERKLARVLRRFAQ